MTEHRDAGRAAIELEVAYAKLNSFFSEYAKTISQGRIVVKTVRRLPAGTRFVIRLALPAHEGFTIRGEVADARSAPDAEALEIRLAWGDPQEGEAFHRGVRALMAQSLGPEVAEGILLAARAGEPARSA